MIFVPMGFLTYLHISFTNNISTYSNITQATSQLHVKCNDSMGVYCIFYIRKHLIVNSIFRIIMGMGKCSSLTSVGSFSRFSFITKYIIIGIKLVPKFNDKLQKSNFKFFSLHLSVCQRNIFCSLYSV